MHHFDPTSSFKGTNPVCRNETLDAILSNGKLILVVKRHGLAALVMPPGSRFGAKAEARDRQRHRVTDLMSEFTTSTEA